MTWFDYLEKQVEIAIYRLRQANDETVVKEAAEAVAYREEAQRVTATMLPVRHAHFGDCLLLVPREEHKALLVKALQKLLPKVSLWKPRPEDARMPRALKPFMRAMGKAGE